MLLPQIFRGQERRPRLGTHGSCACAEKIEDAGFVNAVTDRQHVVTIRDIERFCPWNELGQFLGRAGDDVPGASHAFAVQPTACRDGERAAHGTHPESMPPRA